MLVVLITFCDGKKLEIPIVEQLDIDHTIKVVDAGRVKCDIAIPDRNRRIAQAGKELLAYYLTVIRIEDSLYLLSTLLCYYIFAPCSWQPAIGMGHLIA